MTKLNLESAKSMLENKKGVGVSKKTRVTLSFEFKESVTKATSIIGMFRIYIAVFKMQTPSFFLLKDEVETEFENNPNWKE